VKACGAFILCLLFAATAGFAQVFINGGPNNLVLTPNPAPPVDKTNGVYVRDSAIAMEKLALARRMERAREWNKSADVYQEILEKYPDRVVERTEEPQIQYASVTETVRQSLCKWPLEGLLVYRGRYETPAAKLVSDGGTRDLDKLHEALSRYFPTDAAKTAGIRLIDIYFEQGDYAAASDIGRELLTWHPNLVAERPMVLYRTAIAAKLAGQSDDASHWLTELRNQFPRATGSVRGQDVVLADSLATEISGAQIVHAEVNDSWLTVGGDESRSKGCASTVKPGARLYSVPLMHFNWATVPEPNQRQQMQRNDDDSRKKGAGLGIMPAVDNGQLFFQDNTRIYGVDLDTGTPLPGWLDASPADQGAYKPKNGNPNVPPVPLGRQLCVSVNDKYVTAIMGQSDLLAPNVGPSAQDSRLVCLDRATGKEIWNTTLEDLPESQNALKVLQMCGSPLMVGDNVYVLVHGLKGQFEDCYVACFTLATGRFRWATFLANASADPSIGIMADDTFQYSDAISHIAYASGRLFVVTNIGAVASLDAYTGAIAWLDIYRSEPPAANSALNIAVNPPMRAPDGINGSLASVPWVYNPAIVENGKVFIVPNDSHNLFVYDAGTGALVKQIKLADLQEQRDPSGANNPDMPTTLLAVRDDFVYLAGDRQVWQVPWQSIGKFKKIDYTPKYWRSTDNGSEEEAGTNGHSAEDQPIQIRGRAFVTADSVYLPTERCLRRILLSDGRLDPAGSVFPRAGWEEGKEGPGNIIVTQDHVIVAGDQQVAVYTDVALAKAKLDRAIAEAPNDPDARLHYAEVMFAAGQPDAAEDRLNQGFELLGGTHALRIGASRDRAFNDSLGFAKRSAQKGGDAQQIERFFDLAKAAANAANQQVSYRLARGQYEWTKANRDATSAIALYEEVLADPAYRAVQLADPITNAPTQASTLADKSIEVIKGTPDGKLAYDKFEQIALQKLHDAKLAADPDQLLDIAQVYPDSQVAGDAMLSAASLYESRGNPRMATQVLRRLLLRKHDLDRVPVLEALARNYLRMPGHIDVAVSRLNLAATLAPGENLSEPLVLPNGGTLQNTSLASARDLLAKYESQLSLESLPDLHLPTHEQAVTYAKAMGRWAKPFLPETPNMKIAGVDAMIVPPEDFARNDRIITWSGAGAGELCVYPVGENRPIFTTVAINQTPVGAAWIGQNLLIWTNTAIYLLDGGSGQQKWATEMSSLPNIVNSTDPNAQADADQATGAEEVSQVRPCGDRIVIGTSTGRLLAIDTNSGHVAWQTKTGGTINPLLANSEFTVVRLQSGQTIELQAYNTFNGELVGRKSFGIDTGDIPLNLALAADGTLVYTRPNQLCIQDLFQATLSPTGMDPTMMVEGGPAPINIFQGAGQPEPDQLLIHAGKIYAVANSGKEVRIYSLDSGDPFQFPDRTGRPTIPAAFSTESTSANVRLHISGNYLYVFSPRNLTAHRIDAPAGLWTNSDPTKTTNFQQIIFGKDYVGVVDRPGTPLTESNRSGSKLTLNLFNRHGKDIPADVEAGVLIFQPELQLEGESYALQPVEGGVAFFTGRGTIHFLMGARDSIGN
jgi:outer membrane protein assembly factor BamB